MRKPCFRIALLLLAAFVFAPIALSKPQPWPLPPDDYFLQRVPAPPEKGGAGETADYDYSLAVQAGAQPDQIAHAQVTAAFDVFTFAEVLGPKFTAANYPLTATFFKRLEVTSSGPKNFLKDHYGRLRPIDAHRDTVKEIQPYEAGYSYPSGHSTRSWLYALVLGQLDPPDRHAFLRSAAGVGWDRILGGMHYQSDVIASRTLAQLIYSALMEEPDFVKALGELRTSEWTPPPVAAK